MTYGLAIVRPAEVDVDAIYCYINARSPQGAASWYRAFLACTERICRQPLACAIAPENAEIDIEVRKALFKTRYGAPYRCVLTVVDDEVRILRVRGPGQAPLKAEDVVER